MELHLGHFDKKGETGELRIEGGGAKGSDALQRLWQSRYRQYGGTRAEIGYQVLRGADTVPSVSAGKLDFGATDAAPADAQMAESKGRLYKIPVALGGACVVYHSSRLPQGLRFTGGLLAKMYLGKVRSWNDKEVAEINPDVALPDLPITVIYSREARAASGVFSRYLSATYPEWKEHGPSQETLPLRLEVRPGGENGDVEEEIARKASETDGAIAYVDTRYGLRAGRFELSQGRILNRSGNYVAPTAGSIAASVLEAKGSADLRDSMAKPSSPEAYPMASAFWMVVPVLPEEPKKTFVLLDYINFSLKKGQDSELESGYVPLPPALVTSISKELNTIAAGLLERVRRPHIM
jgi:phosphate transport system substrate-binding protein